MKKYLLITIMSIFTIALGLSLNACRKGAEDPLLSLRSRKARLVGEWNLKAGRIEYKSDTSNTVTVFDGVNKIETINGKSDTSACTIQLVFKRDGTYSSTQITTTHSSVGSLVSTIVETSVENGTWDFNAGTADEKAKIKVLKHPLNNKSTRVTTTNGNVDTNVLINTLGGNDFSQSWYLTRLSNKELKFTLEIDQTSTGLVTGTASNSTSLTFVAK